MERLAVASQGKMSCQAEGNQPEDLWVRDIILQLES